MTRWRRQMWLLALVISACTVPEPDYLIAYNVLVDEAADDYEVFVMTTDGSESRNVSNREGVDWVYAAHGDRLFFLSDRDSCRRCYHLYEMAADGRDVRRVSPFRLRDSWFGSRFDGTQWIVNPHPSVDSVFYIIDRSGNLVQRVPHGLAYASDPVFSPDGTEIVFRGAHAPFKGDAGYLDELYRMKVDGSARRQLTHYPKNDSSAAWYDYHAGPPVWEPHSNRITFNSVRDGTSALYRIQPDGSQLERLTAPEEYAAWHSWSPDGDWFVYDVRLPLTDSTYTYEIVRRSDGASAPVRLTFDTRYNQAPVVVRRP